jgi:hypothetical protein
MRVLFGSWSVRLRFLLFVSLLLGVLLSWPLWTRGADHEIPLFPFLPSFCAVSRFSTLLLVPLFLSMGLLCVFPSHRGLMAAWFSCIFLLVVVDENRLLPWLIQYVVMFSVLCIDLEEPEFYLRLVLGGIYLHSGNKRTRNVSCL